MAHSLQIALLHVETATIMATIFPFSAIVGQDRMKRALVLNAIYPQIGGVLIRGERGTAKSTAARALAAILPEIDVIEGDPYSCDPENRPGRGPRICAIAQSAGREI